jgi:hypothetical protein
LSFSFFTKFLLKTFFEFFHFSRKFNPKEETALVKTFFEFSIFTKFYSWVCVINADGTVSEKLVPCVVTVSQKELNKKIFEQVLFSYSWQIFI